MTRRSNPFLDELMLSAAFMGKAADFYPPPNKEAVLGKY